MLTYPWDILFVTFHGSSGHTYMNFRPHSFYFISFLNTPRETSGCEKGCPDCSGTLTFSRFLRHIRLSMFVGKYSHKKCYPFWVLKRPLDGTIRLRYQGDNTSSQWRNFIANCPIYKDFCDHCVSFISQRWNEICLQSRLPFDLFKLSCLCSHFQSLEYIFIHATHGLMYNVHGSCLRFVYFIHTWMNIE